LPNGANTKLRSANNKIDKIPIQITTGNGKIIIIEVPPKAVEEFLDHSKKLPYSPKGVYVFYHTSNDEYYDVFITNFDGLIFEGTIGFPAGGPYEYIGPVNGVIAKTPDYVHGISSLST
jgi:hypothetical protein